MKTSKKIIIVLFTVLVLIGVILLFQRFDDKLSSSIKPNIGEAPTTLVSQGKRAARSCEICHDLTSARKMTRVGPPLWGIYNAPAGKVKDYPYSAAHLKKASEGIIWDRATLDIYLKNPKEFIPGNTMAFAGIKVDEERQALIDYLKSLNRPKEEPQPPLIEQPPPVALRYSTIDENSQEIRAKKGEIHAEKCAACHDLTQKKEIIVGPYLWGIVGRPAGQVIGFPYSEGFKNKIGQGMVWSSKNLEDFIKNPRGFIPDTKMLFDGIPRSEQRHDLLIYLRTLK
ncbi:MAG: hypothetical protein H7832_06925 [Magnetococcus sp. DMHC-6]